MNYWDHLYKQYHSTPSPWRIVQFDVKSAYPDNVLERSPMDRVEALKQARQIVADLHATKNDRGYPRFSGNVNDVLNQELMVARFLLDEE